MTSVPAACTHSQSPGFVTDPIDALMAEHEVILAVLEALETRAKEALADAAFRPGLWAAFPEFLTNFADRCHHGKEEQLLFPMLVRRGLPDGEGPIGVMKAEHEQGRSLLRELAAAVAREDSRAAAVAALAIVRLLRDHIGKENHVLFPIGRRLLDKDATLHLTRAFATVEREIMGEGTHCKYLDLAKRICADANVDFHRTRSAGAAGGCCGHHAKDHVVEPPRP